MEAFRIRPQDGVDNNCDGNTDEAGSVGEATWCQDADGDGRGNPSLSITACDQPVGYVSDNTDCDDSNAAVNLDATENCSNGIDDDCDGDTDGDDSDCDSWLALLLCEKGDPFGCGLRSAMQIQFAEGLNATVLERDTRIPRLWKLRFSISGTQLVDFIYRLGKPIRYEYVSASWDLDYYQTVYATEPGSAEMPSAGRAFTWKLLLDLKSRGIDTAYIVLHTGLCSYMDDELDAQHPASEEQYLVSATTAEKINQARARGGRVIAVGTTVVRALESVVDPAGRVEEAHGYTQLRINNQHRLQAVDGLLTGLHEPEASHLDLLSAFLPPEKIRDAYEEAIAKKYLWHEFGDLNLIL